MLNTVISVENLSKNYRLGVISTGTFYGDLHRWWAKRGGKPDPYLKIGQVDHGNQQGETIWALKDINFRVQQGEVLGIIGRNGAGKSTLLRILSRVTAPTEGVVKLKGRFASLLEVGTGFHPELTGRENIYLNGAIMGMKKVEIDHKFDEIVDFSGIEAFIDTPVKRYSSGMYVRLAFAVSAHLESEILLVDEVLAVGDAAFQKKCLGKMGDVAREGRTILFVSHNMVAVLSLCSRALWLKNGTVLQSGDVGGIVEEYMQSTMSENIVPLAERKDRHGNGNVKFMSISVEAVKARGGNSLIHCSDQLRIRVGYLAAKSLHKPRFLISINDHTNACIYFLDSETAGGLPEDLPPTGFITCTTGSLNITPGQCYVNIAVMNGNDLADHVQYAASLAVEPEDFHGTGKLATRQQSVCLIEQSWLSEEQINED
jgi:lipopolysaccharide transport system ATP-binding protein